MNRLPLANGRGRFEATEETSGGSGAAGPAPLAGATPPREHVLVRSCIQLVRTPGVWQVAVAALLLILPAALYWDTIFHRYGFRDDYAVLRLTHDEPGRVFQVSAAHARPLYGALLEQSFARLRSIDDLKWLRLLSAVLVGGVALATYRLIRAAKWDRATAALLAALIVTLPGAQLLVSWAVAWPLSVGLLLALGAFACAEKAFGDRAAPLRHGFWAAAVALTLASALTYRVNTLFYFVPVAAALWPRRRWAPRSAFRWLTRHFATVALGVGAAFVMMRIAFANGWASTTTQLAGLEHEWADKFSWFILEPLQNAFALIVLNDDDGSRLAYRTAALVAVVVFASAIRQGQTRGWWHGVWWLAALAMLLVASFSLNLVVADRWAAYRALLPLTAVVGVFVGLSLLTLGGRAPARCTLAGLALVGAWLAQRQTFDLIARPQRLELGLIEKAAERIVLEGRPSVFVITPGEFDRVSPRSFRDEFGSSSTDSNWTPEEMLKLVLAERAGGLHTLRRISQHYTYASGRKLPASEHFDYVIDLRRLRIFRESKRMAVIGR